MKRDVSTIQPEPGTELFSSIDPSPRGDGDKWQVGFGPLEGSGAAWVLYRRGRDGRRTAHKVHRSFFPGETRLYVWLATTVGPKRARATLRTIGPLEDFYRRYVAGRPDLGPSRATGWTALATIRPRPDGGRSTAA